MFKMPKNSAINQSNKDIMNANDMYQWNKKKKTNQSVQVMQEAEDIKKPIFSVYDDNKKNIDINITQKDLKEAIIWSEILGKPMCKRGKRRNYVN